MSKKISVICAVQPKPNPGMSSVDLAFYAFAKRNYPDAEVRFLKICDEAMLHQKRTEGEKQKIRQRFQLPFEYGCFAGHLDELYNSDLIVYWGDFFHMAHYRESEAKRQVKLGIVDTMQQGLDFVDKHFFLADAPKGVFKKVVIFGENLLFNNIDNYTSGTYSGRLINLLKKVDKIWMRDVFSALSVSHLKNDYYNSCLGMDCSVLLKEDDLAVLKRNFSADKKSGQDKVGVFFHRNSKNIFKQFRFAKNLVKATGHNAQWLPWRIDKRVLSKKRWCFRGLELPSVSVDPSEGDLFDLLQEYEYVITDTYHVCVNAWRLGTPAICIGEHIVDATWDVSCGPEFAWRDKRWVFFSMIEALNYYVHAEELAHSRRFKKRIQQLASALRKENEARSITAFMHHQRDNLEKQLVEAFNNILSS